MEHSTVIDAPIADVRVAPPARRSSKRLIPVAAVARPQRGAVTVVGHSSARSTAGDPLVGAHLPSVPGRGPLRRSTRHADPAQPRSVDPRALLRADLRHVDPGHRSRHHPGAGRCPGSEPGVPGTAALGDLAAHRAAADAGGVPMTVAVTGSSGLIGSALCAFLSTGGHRVVRLVRSTPGSSSGSGIDQRHWDPDDPRPTCSTESTLSSTWRESRLPGRFDAAHKRAVHDSRIGPTRRLAEIMGGRTFVVTSAVGIYGPDRGDEILTERSERGDGFLADVVSDWRPPPIRRESHSRVTHVRTGIVQSPWWRPAPLASHLRDRGRWTDRRRPSDAVDRHRRHGRHLPAMPGRPALVGSGERNAPPRSPTGTTRRFSLSRAPAAGPGPRPVDRTTGAVRRRSGARVRRRRSACGPRIAGGGRPRVPATPRWNPPCAISSPGPPTSHDGRSRHVTTTTVVRASRLPSRHDRRVLGVRPSPTAQPDRNRPDGR